MTEEKTNDLEKRVKSFNEELILLLGKYKLGLGAQPVVNGQGVPGSDFLNARPLVFDDVPQEKKADAVESAEKKATDLASV
uniref:Uncharacterized protein n=1 Tax=viral metagenome TaxID=1070528 RepID=A0A6H1ZR18_9ZZZZ